MYSPSRNSDALLVIRPQDIPSLLRSGHPLVYVSLVIHVSEGYFTWATIFTSRRNELRRGFCSTLSSWTVDYPLNDIWIVHCGFPTRVIVDERFSELPLTGSFSLCACWDGADRLVSDFGGSRSASKIPV